MAETTTRGDAIVCPRPSLNELLRQIEINAGYSGQIAW